jgi:hypothetical protein
MEPLAPEGYTGNVMEDGDSFYIRSCIFVSSTGR